MGRHLVRGTAAALAGAAVAAAVALATTDPKSLVLPKSDFPAGTRAGTAYGVKGPTSSTYTAAFNIRPGDARREEDVTIQVWVAKDVTTAKAIYTQTIASYTGKGPAIGLSKNAFKGEAVLKLPSYGDEQFADYLPNPQRPHGQLIVRMGSVVWYLTVENCTPLAFSCYGTSRTEPAIGKARATAELKAYGAKEKARVGR
ncbi:MAG TPA: hypothetical protein VFA24_04890 [Gaiellaceae bacterium]|nr:hypothetical protein [Gaiellaceae bacterium]